MWSSSPFQLAKMKKGSTATVAIRHNNHTGRWLTPFKAIVRGTWWHCVVSCAGVHSRLCMRLAGEQFDPASSRHVVIGNMTRGIDIFDASDGRLVTTLRSEPLTAVPTRSAIHPTRNWIVSSTASGRMYLWE